MKTYQEAARMMLNLTVTGAADDADRLKGIATDVFLCPDTLHLVELMHKANGTRGLRSFAELMLVLGVRIGMEMERSEFPSGAAR